MKKTITAEGLMKKEAGQIRRAIDASCIAGIHRLYPYEFPQGTEQEGKKRFAVHEVEAWKEYQAFIRRHEEELADYDDIVDMPHRVAAIVYKALAGMKAGLMKNKDFRRGISRDIDKMQGMHMDFLSILDIDDEADIQNTLKGIISFLDTCLALGVPLDDDAPAVAVISAALLQTEQKIRRLAE